MASASSPAATRLAAAPMAMTAKRLSAIPKASALMGPLRPAGIGRLRVRCIKASLSRSYPLLIAAAAPAPTALQHTAAAAPQDEREHGVEGKRWASRGDS